MSNPVEFQKVPANTTTTEGPNVDDLAKALQASPGEWFAVKGAPSVPEFWAIHSALVAKLAGRRNGTVVEADVPAGRGMPRVRLVINKVVPPEGWRG